MTKSKMLNIIGLVFPYSFEFTLSPFKECYYVSNSFLKISFENNDAIQGTFYEYGFDGWDGSNTNSCKLKQNYPLD